MLLLLLLAAAAPPDPASIKTPDDIAVCDELYRQWPEEKAPFFCYFKYARKHLKWKETAARLERLRRKRPREPNLLYTLALIYEMGFNRSGLELRLEAAEGFGRRGKLSQQAEALTAASEDFDLAGRFPEGLQTLERAGEVAAAAKDEERMAVVRVWRAKHALALEDYGLAAALLRAEQSGDYYAKAPPWFRWSVLNNLALASSALGRHREAFELQRQRVEETSAIPYMQAAARHSVAVEAVRLSDEGELADEEADRLVREALEAEVAAGARSYVRDGELRTRVLLARRLGATKEGLEQVERALALEHDFQPDPAQRASALRLLARMRMDADRANAPEALRLADEALTIARSVSAHEGEAAGLLARADVEFRSGARGPAVRDALDALDTLERIRDRQPEELVRAFAGAERAWAFELVAGWLLDPARGGGSPADLELSLQALERLRAATLVESLDAGKPSGRTSSRRDRALQRIVAAQRNLSRLELTPEARAKEHAELEKAEHEEEAARDELARKAPASRVKTAPPSLRDLQAALGADEALLAFQIFSRRTTDDAPYDDGSSWVIAVSHTDARAFRIPDAKQLAAAAALFPALIARRDGSDQDGAARLHADLLAAPLAWLGPRVTRLAVVPDNALQRLPFEALRETPSGPPLAVRYQIALTPSAGLWLRFRRARPAPAQKPVLVLADPKTSAAPLTFGREEANAAIEALGGGTVLAGADATERAMKRLDLHSYALVHFAAHAVVDEERPGRSAILLAPGGPDEDGLLQMREVAQLALEGRAVVLAACSSSRGTVLPGEGVLGLGRAFFQAGAHTVLGTLWPLRDDESAAFYSAFYRSLGAGASLGTAFAAARRERIAAGDPAAAWAGHVLLGDDSMVIGQ